MTIRNLPAKISVPLPSPTPCATRSMSLRDIEEHRKRIGFEVSVILKADYWTPDLSREELAANIANWCDALEDWPLDQIREALNEHRDTRPDKRPNAGHILSIMKAKRGQEFVRRISRVSANPTVATQPMTPEQHAAVSADLGHKYPDFREIMKLMPKVSE